MLGQPVRCANQEVAGANRWIADFESQDGFLCFRGRFALNGLFDNGVKRRVQQALHERVRRVVRTGGLALIAGYGAEGEDAGCEFHGGVEFEQALIDAAQFLAAQVAVVHQPPAAAVLDECEIANREKQMFVGELRRLKIGHGFGAKEKPTESWKTQFRATVIVAQLGKDKAHGDPKIGVPTAARALCHATQPLAAIEAGIARSGFIGCAGRVEQVSVFGDEEENQPVDQPEQLAIVVLLLQLAGLEAITKSLVRLVGNEAGAKILKSLLNADTQLIEGAASVGLRLLGPLFEPAGFWTVLCSAFKPRLVADHPKQTEV